MRYRGISRLAYDRRRIARSGRAPGPGLATALLRATIRQLCWGLRAVSGEVERWQTRVRAIPDHALRADGLHAITRKRGNIDGAALFWTLPDRRDSSLLRLLVAYEVMADFLDCVSERGAHAGPRNGRQLHRALIDALDQVHETSDYYRHNPNRDDCGYLLALVCCCRSAAEGLPSLENAREPLLDATTLTQVLAINHEPDPRRRNHALAAWSETHLDHAGRLMWFERPAAASAWLTVLALLAAASEAERTKADLQRISGAYLPWISLVGTMLDSHGDVAEDTATAAHSYIDHYGDLPRAVRRISYLLNRSLTEARSLPNGDRHAVLVACMASFYLSKDTARTAAMQAGTRRLVRCGGPLTRLLTPILRLWRLAYGQRSA